MNPLGPSGCGRNKPSDPMAPSGSGDPPGIAFPTLSPHSERDNHRVMPVMILMISCAILLLSPCSKVDRQIQTSSLVSKLFFWMPTQTLEISGINYPLTILLKRHSQASLSILQTAHGPTGQLFFRDTKIAGVRSEWPIGLPPRLTIESTVPMISVFRMAENPEIERLNHCFFYITPTAPHLHFNELAISRKMKTLAL